MDLEKEANDEEYHGRGVDASGEIAEIPANDWSNDIAKPTSGLAFMQQVEG